MSECLPINKNISVYEGDDCTLKFTSELGDLTGYTVKFQARIDTSSRYAIIDLDGQVTDTSGGYEVTFPSNSTLGRSSDKAYRYDIKLTAPNKAIHTAQYGMMEIKPRTTDIGDTTALPIDGDMKKSVYDTDDSGVVDAAESISTAASAHPGEYYGKDSQGVLGFHTPVGANGNNIDVSSLVNNALIKWDATRQKFVNAQVYSNDAGSISLEPSSLNIGSHRLSSSAETLTVTNLVTDKIYAPLWQEIGFEKGLGYVRIYGKAKKNPIQTDISQDLTNPSFTIPVVDNLSNFGADINLTNPATNVEIHVTEESKGMDIWLYKAGDLKAGPQTIMFENPADFRGGNKYRVTVKSSDGSDVVLKGGVGFDGTLIPAFTTYFTDWKDEIVSTRSWVESLGLIQDLSMSGGTLTAHKQDGTVSVLTLPDPADLDAVKKQVEAHETAINNHGNTLAAHENQIQTNTNNIKLALDASTKNAESIVTSRKNAASGFSLEQNKAAKTITIKMTSESGIIDTGVIDLTGWFDGGGTAPTPDHIIYYGFSEHPPMDEAEILRLGTKKTVPTVAGLDISITRSDITPKNIWVWLPDSVGTIKGFTFSGFLSTWASTAVSVAGAPGKFYQSPHPTSATTVNFEVTQ